MAAPAADTANLALVRNKALGTVLIDGTDLNYIAAVVRGLGATFTNTYQRGQRTHSGQRWNALTAALVVLGSTQAFPRLPLGTQMLTGQNFNQVLAATRALNV